MRIVNRLIAGFFFSFSLISTGHAATVFQATLEGSQEVPNVMTNASGTATFTLNDAQTRLEMMISIIGIDLDGNQTMDTDDDLVGLHLHAAPAGSNGGVVFGIINPNSDLNNDTIVDATAGTVFTAWDLNEGFQGENLSTQLMHLLTASIYINAHTQAFPGGEIRGQIVPSAVPIPGALILLSTGLVGLFGASRRKKKQLKSSRR